ncbi:carboxylesterase type B [Catenibacillus scindens]|uniref:Carboxylesterase type B n=1 Tax=Catenibacillus scindens TaxID=673271 RepID=A0A7W8M4P2_9FIRM|nr:carboxylesterase family protein [Catenibacillus scindens]MBB5264368.1 carboxylesterase type B [Catenibacillus scindens]
MMPDVIGTCYGKVEGVHGNNAGIMVYKGIPYAAPPVGKLRFMPPVSPEKWDGIRKCHEFSKISLQPRPMSGTPFGDFFIKEFYPYKEPQSEDSLYLNVWTPADSAGDRLPVWHSYGKGQRGIMRFNENQTGMIFRTGREIDMITEYLIKEQ